MLDELLEEHRCQGRRDRITDSTDPLPVGQFLDLDQPWVEPLEKRDLRRGQPTVAAPVLADHVGFLGELPPVPAHGGRRSVPSLRSVLGIQRDGRAPVHRGEELRIEVVDRTNRRFDRSRSLVLRRPRHLGWELPE
jgi:hypothetical protein